MDSLTVLGLRDLAIGWSLPSGEQDQGTEASSITSIDYCAVISDEFAREQSRKG